MNKQPNTLTELLAHALMLAEKGESLAGKFLQRFDKDDWTVCQGVPNLFSNQYEWRIVAEDQHLLDDGWIRHTGDVCPVHRRDMIIYAAGGIRYDVEFMAGAIRWDGITHYKVTNKYDPHAENKALYAVDALAHKEPWKLWEVVCGNGMWVPLAYAPSWDCSEYRRKQTKKLVDWSCPLLKGASTNYGALHVYSASKNGWLTGSHCCPKSGLAWRLNLGINICRVFRDVSDDRMMMAYEQNKNGITKTCPMWIEQNKEGV